MPPAVTNINNQRSLFTFSAFSDRKIRAGILNCKIGTRQAYSLDSERELGCSNNGPVIFLGHIKVLIGKKRNSRHTMQ